MKKITVIIAIIIVILSVNKQQNVIIPKDSIRFRVIANSNSESDQALKKQVVSNLKDEIISLEFTPKNLSSSREKIQKELPKFENIVKNTIKESNSSTSYSINYGQNYFPEKEYKGLTYKEGNYESLIITLGDGLGENFWCVLFPPLCLIEADEDEDINDVEYTSIIKEIIDKYF